MKVCEGQVAVITGAASGIGLALAQRFAEDGLKVVLADIETERLGRAVNALVENGATVIGHETDVSDAASVETLAARAEAVFGPVHILCNNAGVSTFGKMWELTASDWEWVIGVNFWGVVHGIRSFIPRMLAHGENAHVVNTASVAGVASLPGIGPYLASKHAIVSVSEGLSQELRQDGANIGVSVLCPEFVKTNIAESERNRPNTLEDSCSNLEISQSLKPIVNELGLEPDDVAKTVVDAISANRFCIYTHPDDTIPKVEDRAAYLTAGELPTLHALQSGDDVAALNGVGLLFR